MSAIIGTDLAVAADWLRRGELVGLPTETVYGLAGNALDPAAVAKIFHVKQRPAFDPLIMHFPDLAALEPFVTGITPAARQLAERYWPGPLTLVFPRRDVVPDLVTAELDSVAVRVPRHPLALGLLRSVDFPLAAPSANPFGYVSPTRPDHVTRQLGDQIPYVLDGGPTVIGLESTIVSFAGSEPRLLRRGGLALEELEDALGQTLVVNTHSSSNPAAPGMLAQHYSPGVPLALLPELSDEALESKVRTAPEVAFLVFGRPGLADYENVFDLSTAGDLREAAARLFATLRQLDELDFQRIFAELLPERGLGRAVNDRLRRAGA